MNSSINDPLFNSVFGNMDMRAIFDEVEVEIDNMDMSFIVENLENEDNNTTPPDYSQKTCVELREMLKLRNLKVSGSKEELQQRLKADDEGAFRQGWEKPQGTHTFTRKEFKSDKVGPKDADLNLSPLGIWMLFWEDILEELTQSINKKLKNMTVCLKYNK